MLKTEVIYHQPTLIYFPLLEKIVFVFKIFTEYVAIILFLLFFPEIILFAFIPIMLVMLLSLV